MREIKYRGLNTKGEWVYGSLVNTTHGIEKMPHTRTKTWIVESAFGNGGWFNVTRRQYVKPETVGQFTGLKDKNGTDIYKDDILVDSAQGVLWVVSFSCRGFFMAHDPKNPEDFVFLDDLNFIVHGNIHENPELMERNQ